MLRLALGVATAVVAGPIALHRWPRRARTNWMIVGGGATAVVVLLAVGAAAPIVDRALSFASLGVSNCDVGTAHGRVARTPDWRSWTGVDSMGPPDDRILRCERLGAATSGQRPCSSSSPRQGCWACWPSACVAVAIVPAIFRATICPSKVGAGRIRCGGHRRQPDGIRLPRRRRNSVDPRMRRRASPVQRPNRSQMPTWPRYAALAMLAVIGVGYASTMVASFAYASAASLSSEGRAAFRRGRLEHSGCVRPRHGPVCAPARDDSSAARGSRGSNKGSGAGRSDESK